MQGVPARLRLLLQLIAVRTTLAISTLAALTCLAGEVRAAPDPGIPKARLADVALEPAIEALMRHKLEGQLAPKEIDRLLREPRVRASLAGLFEGWDGIADEVLIARDNRGELIIETTIRERRCLTNLELGPERGPSEPVCDDTVRLGGERRLVVDDRLWRTPKPKSRPQVAAVAATTEPAPEPTGPVENTVLRRTSPGAIDVGPVMEARAQHEDLKGGLRRPHWKDPMLPADAVEAGEALRPFHEPSPPVEARVDTNLRNPFGDGRMRTQDPVPDMLTLPNNGQSDPLLPTLSDECTQEWRLNTGTPQPPTLDCYRRVAWHDRLEGNDAYQALSRIASVLQLPLLDTLIAIQVQDAVSHQAHRLVWALVWVSWVKFHPDRTAEALADLTPEERRFVRRRLADWWVEAKLVDLRPTITRLFERHFLGLYPEAMDLDGLPRRTFVSDTWLWANNWLAILDGRSNSAITAAYERLSLPERRVIGAFVRDRDLARRWARAAEVIAGL